MKTGTLKELETLEIKAEWFRKLSPEERLEAFDEFMELILSLNPELFKSKVRNAQSLSRDILILRKESG
ncbi:MAG TPA: hypothetical protein ENJ40_09195 [Thermosulfurimonas dismutans]|uniref:Uncharacterized protein n=1 Tax=Thermosulfurimonas dismutans TaxID=999894 RepID=A0A7C3CQQ4_9BACT|nr:hypothetical protein [Thermosulfurimonas dismutans]